MIGEENSTQESLFGGGGHDTSISEPSLPDIQEWTNEECLRREKEIIGFYLSGDPLEKYIDDIKEFTNVDLANIPQKKPNIIRIGGIIKKTTIRYDKKNRPWAIVELSGSIGKADVFVFNDVFEKTKDHLTEDNCIFIGGSPSNRDDDAESLKMIASNIFHLSCIREKLSKNINVLLPPQINDASILNQIKELINQNKGKCGFIIHLQSESGSIQEINAAKFRVNASKDFIFKLRALLGEKYVWIS